MKWPDHDTEQLRNRHDQMVMMAADEGFSDWNRELFRQIARDLRAEVERREKGRSDAAES